MYYNETATITSRMNGIAIRSCVVILPACGLTRWQRDCVARLQHECGIDVVGVIQAGESRETRIPRRLGHVMQRILDSGTRPRLARRASLPAALADTAGRSVAIEAETRSLALSAADTDWITATNCDFVLSFDARPNPACPALAPAGTWAFAIGDPPALGQASPGVRELGQRKRRLGFALQRVASADAPATALAAGFTPATPYSRKRSLARLYEIGPDLLRMTVSDQRAGRIRPAGKAAQVGSALRAAEWALFFAAIGRETIVRWIEKLIYRQQWHIGLIKGRALMPSARELENAQWLANPRGVFHADPCFVPDDAQRLLVEEYPHVDRRGRITALTWPDDSLHQPPRAQTVLDTDGHLSFPRAYRRDGRLWLVPEMADQGVQYAYAMDSNARLVDQAPITIEGLRGIDPILFEVNGRHWAWVSPTGRRANYQLELFHADNFFGPYHPHPANPIQIDPHGGRCAGPVIARDGRRYRFGQVFGRHYGEAIDVFEIVTLDLNAYEEEYLGRIQPAGGERHGVHSIDFAQGMTVVDGYWLQPRWADWFRARRH